MKMKLSGPLWIYSYDEPKPIEIKTRHIYIYSYAGTHHPTCECVSCS
jgi:hypothetical protein